jgi:hypothetical protein
MEVVHHCRLAATVAAGDRHQLRVADQRLEVERDRARPRPLRTPLKPVSVSDSGW